MNEPRRLSQRWVDRRQRLHEVLETQVGFNGNASTLERMGQGKRRWTEQEVAALWATAAARPGRGEEVNHVYVHVPFCKSICHFCNYKRLRPGSRDLMDTWLRRLEGSLRTIGPSLRGFEFHSLYVGGGTPSLLPAPMIDELLAMVGEHVPFVSNAARFFEADPAVLDDQKLQALTRHGVQHVSMGVQTLDAAVNEAHDRGPQGPELIARRVEALRAAGIHSTSMDFLLGLHGTEPEQIFDEVERTVAQHAPRWVDLFFLTPTARYVELHFDGSYEAFWAHQRRFADLSTRRLTEICQRHGYDMHGDVYDAFVLRRRPRGAGRLAERVMPWMDRLTDTIRHNPGWLGGVPRRLLNRLRGPLDSPYTYNHLVSEQHLPLNLLGLGSGARARIYGHAYLEYTDPGDDPAAEGAAEYTGIATDMAFEARSYLIMTLRDANVLPAAKVRQLFGQGLHELLPEALAAWEQLGVGHVRQGDLHLAPSDRQGRGRALMWLLDDAVLEAEVLRHRNMTLDRATLLALLAPLTLGQPVAPGVVLAGVDDGELRLRGEGGAEVRLRVAPRLDRKTGVELLPQSAPPGIDLRAVVRRLDKLFVRNGAELMGIVQVPEIDVSAFSEAGQHEPAAREDGRRARPQRRSLVPAPVRDLSSEPASPLSPAQSERYWERGYVNAVPVLTSAESARFRTWLELIEAEQAARHGGVWTDRSFDPERHNDHPFIEWADELMQHPRLLDAVESVLGPNLLVRNVDLFVRMPHVRDGVEWHRDTAALGPEADKMLTAWLGLNPSRPDNGGMRFVPGSHRTLLHGEALTHDDLTFTPALISQLHGVEVVDNEMPEGHVSLHHIRTIHSSGGNSTSGRRIGVVLRFLAAEVDPVAAHCGVARLVRGSLNGSSLHHRARVPVSWRV